MLLIHFGRRQGTDTVRLYLLAFPGTRAVSQGASRLERL